MEWIWHRRSRSGCRWRHQQGSWPGSGPASRGRTAGTRQASPGRRGRSRSRRPEIHRAREGTRLPGTTAGGPSSRATCWASWASPPSCRRSRSGRGSGWRRRHRKWSWRRASGRPGTWMPSPRSWSPFVTAGRWDPPLLLPPTGCRYGCYCACAGLRRSVVCIGWLEGEEMAHGAVIRASSRRISSGIHLTADAPRGLILPYLLLRSGWPATDGGR